MQHLKYTLALLTLSACVAVAETTSPEAACRELSAGLTRELVALQSMQDAASAAASLPELRAAMDALAAMDRSYEAEKALWAYIDNTDGVKQPLVELLQRLSIEFTRLELAEFYGNEELRACLAPQMVPPPKDEQAEDFGLSS